MSREARMLVGAKRRPPKSSKMSFSAARRSRAAEKNGLFEELSPPLDDKSPPSPGGLSGEGGDLTLGIGVMVFYRREVFLGERSAAARPVRWTGIGPNRGNVSAMVFF